MSGESSTADTDAVKVSTEGAEQFTDAYYTALQGSRHTIADYYIDRQTIDGKAVPAIAWNGNEYVDGPAIQSMFEHEMPYTFYDVSALNCHVLHPAHNQPPPTNRKEAEKNMSIVVVVNGTVRLEERDKGPVRAFSETLILVPVGPNTGRNKKGHGWVIQTQNFRYTV